MQIATASPGMWNPVIISVDGSIDILRHHLQIEIADLAHSAFQDHPTRLLRNVR